MSKILNKEDYRKCVEKACELAEKRDFMFVSSVSLQKKKMKSKFNEFNEESGLITCKLVEIPQEEEHYISVKDVDLLGDGVLEYDKSVEDQVDTVLNYIEEEVFNKGNAAVLSLLGLEVNNMISDNIKVTGASTNVVISKASDNEYSLDVAFDTAISVNKAMVFLAATEEQTSKVFNEIMCA